MNNIPKASPKFKSSNAPSAVENDSSDANPKIQRIRLLLADVNRMANQLLASALEREPRFSVVGTAESIDQVLAACREEPDVVLIAENIGGSPSGGVHVLRRLLAGNPNRIRAIMLLDRLERDSVVESFRAGATGIFCRTEPTDALWRCIETVHQGKVWAHDEELRFVLDALATFPSVQAAENHQPLAEREKQIVRLVAEGLTNKQIAAELELNENTLKTYLKHLFEKLHVSTRSELVFEVSSHTASNNSHPVKPEEDFGCPTDDPVWFEWYSRAAEHLYPFAQLTLGEMYRDGRGAPKDSVAAYAWFVLAESSLRRIMSRSQTYRESLATEMTDDQIAEAEQNASEWLERRQKALSKLDGNGGRKNRISHPKLPTRGAHPKLHSKKEQDSSSKDPRVIS